VEIEVGYGAACRKSKRDTPAEDGESHWGKYEGQNNHEFSYAIQCAGIKSVRPIPGERIVLLGAIWQEKQVLPFDQDDDCAEDSTCLDTVFLLQEDAQLCGNGAGQFLPRQHAATHS
jgi:hypothetical protein